MLSFNCVPSPSATHLLSSLPVQLDSPSPALFCRDEPRSLLPPPSPLAAPILQMESLNIVSDDAWLCEQAPGAGSHHLFKEMKGRSQWGRKDAEKLCLSKQTTQGMSLPSLEGWGLLMARICPQDLVLFSCMSIKWQSL